MENTKHRSKIKIPSNIPPSEWCDFRKDYESGMSLHAIGEKYFCDPRTVRNCIIRNKSSSELGRKSTPSILEPYHREIQQILHELSGEEISVYKQSMAVTRRLKDSGYSGSERTVRNYLKNMDRTPENNSLSTLLSKGAEEYAYIQMEKNACGKHDQALDEKNKGRRSL